LIESSNNGILGIIKSFDQVPKKNGQILAVDQKFIKLKMTLLKISINCQKRTDRFFHLIEFFDQLKSVQNFGQLIMKILIN
jgi:hypothetical protein